MMRALATVLLTVLCAPPSAAGIRTVWAVGDGDKIKRDSRAELAPNRRLAQRHRARVRGTATRSSRSS
jgi:hypothetical protein